MNSSELYEPALFLHVMGAIVLVSFGVVMPMMMAFLHRTPTVAGLREWASAISKYGSLGPKAAVLVLLSGSYMVWVSDGIEFSDGWVAVSFVMFVIAGGLAGGLLDPHFTKVLAAAEGVPEGPVPSDLREMAAAPKVAMAESLMFGLDVATVFNMTNKPDLVGALAAAAVGLAIAGVLIAMRRRHTVAVAV